MGQLLKVEDRINGGGRQQLTDFDNHLEIRLPDLRVLRLVARSLLLFLAIVSFRNVVSILPGSVAARIDADLARSNARANLAGASAAKAHALLRSMDDVFFLPMLLRDLKRRGLIGPADRTVFLGDPNPRLLPLLKHHKMDLIAGHDGDLDRPFDFVFSDGFQNLDFIDRALKLGGIAAVRMSSDPSRAFRMPSNYRTVYIRKFSSTIVAMRKVAAGAAPQRRRLLAVPDATKEALNGLEDVLLEPPRKSPEKYLKKTKYLPELTGDTLDMYPRRMFVDVVGRHGKGRNGGARWFERNYPRRNRDFEMIRVETETETETGTETETETETTAAGGGAVAAAAEEGMSGWMRRNVREEEYVVMKAEAEVVEEMVSSRAIELVDELFLECRGGGGGVEKGRRAYWECLALYGKLRDAGVAVHQWWWA